ncbi:hypothetical protein QUV83_16185 [Cellulomonas cellasea]|uniref:DUF6551 family protein n=1 Tax=Cellulomonas cellasea TaxID=43670 RepID=UPI0025A4B94E|nr:DUF6551 family protein [Cellulomonas cellasea]MDM8086314.1 hypothetical protein [Cellulomonas cellasea]
MSIHPIIKEIRVRDLIVDPAVQRSLDLNRASRIAARFDPSALGAITVSERSDGSHHIVDGQHRSAAARMAQGDDATVLCLVYIGLSVEDEAALFRKLNTTKQVHPLQRFKVRLVEGDPIALILNDILSNSGWSVQGGKEQRKFAAVGALERVYLGAGIKRKGFQQGAVRTTIQTITTAWGHNPDGVRQEIVSGLGMVFIKHPEADANKITRELALLGSPLALISKAKARSTGSRYTLAATIAGLVVELHNKGRRANRLPYWEA